MTSRVREGSAFSARLYEPFLWLAERRGMEARRRAIAADARGRTLEIGAGTGLNLPGYTSAVTELVLAEPVRAMAERIDLAKTPVPAELVEAVAEDLPFEDESFDTVVSTLVLCTVADQGAAISEIRRVLKPGGQLLFAEHVLSNSPRLARWQSRLSGPWAVFAEGCRCDRNTLAALGSQLRIETEERGTWKGVPPIVKPFVTGVAMRD